MRETERQTQKHTERFEGDKERGGIETETQRVEERDIEEERGRDTNTEKKDLEKEGQIYIRAIVTDGQRDRWTKRNTLAKRERENERETAG